MKDLILSFLFKLYGTRLRFLRKYILKITKKLDGGEFYSEWIRKIYNHYHDITIGKGTYGGIFNLANVNKKTTIGNYCSVAPNVYIYNRNHPKNFISMHPFFYNSELKIIDKDTVEYEEKIIGNDVWIGQNAIILPSVKRIGNGVVIAAGAVVTKDIPDFAVVAGVPAKIISYRFSKEDASIISNSNWWQWNKATIIENKQYMFDIEKFKLKN